VKPKRQTGRPRKSLPSIGAAKERLLARLPKANASRLRGLYIRWMNAEPRLTNIDRQELIEAGLIPGTNVVNGNAKYVTLSQFAGLMGVSRHDVQNALNLEHMPGRLSNGTLNREIAEPWWKERKGRTENNIFQQAQTAKAEKEIDEARIKKAEADRQEREVNEKWIEAETVRIFMEGRGVKDCQDVDSLLEDRNGLRETVMKLLMEFVPSISDPLKAQFESALIEKLRVANDDLKDKFRKRAEQPIRKNI
jgi:hypothetical protein